MLVITISIVAISNCCLVVMLSIIVRFNIIVMFSISVMFSIIVIFDLQYLLFTRIGFTTIVMSNVVLRSILYYTRGFFMCAPRPHPRNRNRSDYGPLAV